MMGNTYSKINEEADRKWQLERARIIFAIENEMSFEQRNDEKTRYWLERQEKRYIQILDIDKTHFQKKKEKK